MNDVNLIYIEVQKKRLQIAVNALQFFADNMGHVKDCGADSDCFACRCRHLAVSSLNQIGIPDATLQGQNQTDTHS